MSENQQIEEGICLDALIRPGDIIGPYQVVRAFPGTGGMAQIFEVRVRRKYRRPDVPVRLAMKVARPEYEAALSAEADFLRRFAHPHVVRIYPLLGYHKSVFAAREQFPFGWGWYYTMELVDGGSLAQYLFRTTLSDGLFRARSAERARPLSLLLTLGVARQMVAALEHIHGHHVLNLDVKPNNVLFRRRRFKFLRSTVPYAVLCDFGLARDMRFPRLGILGVVTPEYLSPEQAQEVEGLPVTVDARSDLFSLGGMIYEMLTGQLPFADMEELRDPDHLPPPIRRLRPDVPEPLEQVVMRALAKNPQERFQSTAEMRRSLEAIPLPRDWEALARRGSMGIALIAWLLTSSWATQGILSSLRTNSPTPLPTPVGVPLKTSTPSAERRTPDPLFTETPAAPRPTSTPAPTPPPSAHISHPSASGG